VAYTTGWLDRTFKYAHQTFNKPLPILLTNTYGRLALTPPSWLRRWAYLAGLRPIERSFKVVYQSLRWMGIKPALAKTPAEAAAELSAHLPKVAEEIRSLLREYQLALFSPKHIDLDIARHAGEAIRRQALLTALRQHMAAYRATFLRLFSRKPR
jgi:hypothetical protein